MGWIDNSIEIKEREVDSGRFCANIHTLFDKAKATPLSFIRIHERTLNRKEREVSNERTVTSATRGTTLACR